MAPFIGFLGPHLKLPQEALDQLGSIIETYRLVRSPNQVATNSDKEIERIDGLLKSGPAELWWSDMALAELCVVEVLPIEQLRASLVGWRRRLCDVVGKGRYEEYLTTATTAQETSEAALRADLSECIRGVYYFYGSYGVAALSRTQVTQRLIKWASGILGVEILVLLALWLPWSRNTPSGNFLVWRMIVSVAVTTSMAAVLGSIVSVQRRLQDPSVNVDPFYRYVQTNADWFGTAVISPLFAAIFGLIIYGLLVSDLLSTAVVKLNGPVAAPWAEGAIPAGANSYAAILILGFISGFAEQLIPDALTRIASRALSGVSPTEPAEKPAALTRSTNGDATTSTPASRSSTPPSPQTASTD